MKKILFLIILFKSFIVSSQEDWLQIGSTIYGEDDYDYLAFSALDLNENGTIMAMGSSGNYVRVFKKSQGNWVQIGNDIIDNSNASFGRALSLSDDGRIIAIGAISNPAKVSVFQNQNDNWVQIGNDINGTSTEFFFGESISLSGDGKVLAVGSSDWNDGIQGRVSVYRNENNEWIQIGDNIIKKDTDTDYTGDYTVSLSDNGNTLAIITPYSFKDYPGSVRVYENEADNWVQIGNDITNQLFGDRNSNCRISLSGDGKTIAFGAIKRLESNQSLGYVSVFVNELGEWNKIGEDIESETKNDQTGFSVSLSNQGNLIAFGSLNSSTENGVSAGRISVFKNQNNNWLKLGEDLVGEFQDDLSANTLNFSDDGSTIAIGSPYVTSDNGRFSGQVRVFEFTDVSLSLSDNLLSIKPLKLYPNPSISDLKLSSEVVKINQVSIYNCQGKIMYSKLYNSNEISILTEGLSTGTYFVNIKTNKGQMNKQFIKK